MILITVGTDMPFDRMVRVVDDWARENRRKDVFAQIGEGGWQPNYIQFTSFLTPLEFTRRIISARVVVSHAGMGTILSALHHGKPVLVMPKKAFLGEHRNEHQTATAKRMMQMDGVNVAFDEIELRVRLDQLDRLAQPRKIGKSASDCLVKGLRDYIFFGGRS